MISFTKFHCRKTVRVSYSAWLNGDLDITLNLQNDTDRPYKKPNDRLLYIHSLLNHPPQIIRQLPNSISERLSRNSSFQEIFNTAKVEYDDALKKSSVDLKYTNNKSEKPKTWKRTVIWFNPPFSKSISTNVAKTFLQMVTKHLPRRHKLHKIFNYNTVKVSYSCRNNMSKTIEGHNKKVTSKPCDQRPKCNCRKKQNVQWKETQVNNVLYKCKTIAEKSVCRTCRGRMEEPFLWPQLII